MFKTLAFVALLLVVADASSLIDDRRLFKLWSEATEKTVETEFEDMDATEPTIEVLEYNSTEACCQLSFVKVNHAAVLAEQTNVFSLNTSGGIYHPILRHNRPDFISQSSMKSSPWKRIKTDYFLANPNGCSIQWTSNYTDGINGNSYVPTFGGFMLTNSKFVTRRRPTTRTYDRTELHYGSSYSWNRYFNRSSTTTTTTTTTASPFNYPSNESKMMAEFYSLNYGNRIRSGYPGYDQIEMTRSLLYITCPAQVSKIGILIFKQNDELDD